MADRSGGRVERGGSCSRVRVELEWRIIGASLDSGGCETWRITPWTPAGREASIRCATLTCGA